MKYCKLVMVCVAMLTGSVSATTGKVELIRSKVEKRLEQRLGVQISKTGIKSIDHNQLSNLVSEVKSMIDGFSDDSLSSEGVSWIADSICEMVESRYLELLGATELREKRLEQLRISLVRLAGNLKERDVGCLLEKRSSLEVDSKEFWNECLTDLISQISGFETIRIVAPESEGGGYIFRELHKSLNDHDQTEIHSKLIERKYEKLLNDLDAELYPRLFSRFFAELILENEENVVWGYNNIFSPVYDFNGPFFSRSPKCYNDVRDEITKLFIIEFGDGTALNMNFLQMEYFLNAIGSIRWGENPRGGFESHSQSCVEFESGEELRQALLRVVQALRGS